MAQLDVSDLLLDPDFIDEITMIHRTATVNAFGETVLVEASTVTVGSVQPASGKEMKRLPESLQTADVRSFFIKAAILSDGTSQYPDILVFQGQRFQIQVVQPWLHWGSGWNQGLVIGEVPAV